MAILAAILLECSPAFAEEVIKYDPGSGAETVKTIGGAAYALLLVIFAVRLFQKRAKFATAERLASNGSAQETAPAVLKDVPVKRVTPLKALWAAIQAGVFAYLLYLFSSSVDHFFEGQQLPDQYTARNITITIRTVVSGLSYLLTFLFGANAIGLTAYTVQLIFKPEPDPEAAVLDVPEVLEDVSDRGHDGH